MHSRSNPLDKKPVPSAPSIIVHTASYIKHIKEQNAEFWRLMKIASLNTVPIVFTPVNDKEVQKVLSSLNLDLSEYYIVANECAIKSRFVSGVFSAEMDEVSNKKFEKDMKMSMNDHMAIHSRYFDLCVSDIDPKTTDLSRVLDILQVYHIKNGIFKGFGTGDIGEFFYYLNKLNLIIPEHRILPAVFHDFKVHFPEHYDDLENLMQSLADRITLMEKAAIEVSITH